LVFLGDGEGIFGQETPGIVPGGMMPPENIPRVVGPGILPDLMVMRNQKGEEILVPRARYEDFERLLMETEIGGEGLAATPSLNQLDLLIEPVSDYSKVQVRGLISLKKANRTTWTVPIALSQLQWIPSQRAPLGSQVENPSEAQPDGVESLATSTQANGYLWRLGPGKSLQRRLELDALCKIVSTPSSNSLRLDLPPAATVLRLRLPKGEWELNATGGGNEVVEPFQTQGEYSVAIVRTSSNSINLTWSPKVNRDAIAAVEVRSQTKFSPTGDANRWRVDTAFSIRGPVKLAGKRILLNLPAQGLLREGNSNVLSFPNYRLVRSRGNSESNNSRNQLDLASPPPDPISLVQETSSQAWWIEIDEGYSRSELDINLEWFMSRAPSDSQVVFEAPLLEGVERHNGAIEFAIARTNSIAWTSKGNAQLTRQSQASDGSDSIVYSFQFEGQPAGIVTQWTTIADRPRIGSQQSIEVRESQMLLRGAIEFGTDPIQLPLLQLEAQGWKPERIVLYPSEMDVPLETLPNAGKPNGEIPTGEWSLPISANLWIKTTGPGRPTGSDTKGNDRSSDILFGSLGLGNPFESIAKSTDKTDFGPVWRMEYLLTKNLTAQTQEIEFSLPKLSWLSQETQQRVTRTAPGKLLVASWPYRLTATTGELSGLIESSLDRTLQKKLFSSTPDANPFLMQYQISDSTAANRWVGHRTRKGSFVSAEMSSNVALNQDAMDWNIRWDCKCLGSRPTELRLGIPLATSLSDSEKAIRNLRVKIDNQPTTVESIASDAGIPEGRRWVKLLVPDVSPDGSYRLDFLVEANYSIDEPELTKPSEQVALELNLPILESTKELEQLLVDSSEFRLLHTSSFSVSRSSGSNYGIISVDPRDPRVSIQAKRRTENPNASLKVIGQWVQTIVNALEQRDRYVARFETDQSFVAIRVSPETLRSSEWIIDGQRITVREDVDRKGYATIPFPEEVAKEYRNVHVLEVFTTQAAPKGWYRQVQPIGPRLESGPSSGPFVWQIIVPRTEHLVASTENALPMYQWRWSDLFLRRVGELSQEQMEEKLGASTQPILAQQVNQYDLNCVASTRSLEATFVPSALIWLPVSLTVLVLAVVLKGNRWIRWPWFWAVFFAFFFIFSQIFWDISLLVLQAAIAAVGLAMVYSLARWLMDRRARRRSIFVSRNYTPAGALAKGTTGSNISKKFSQDGPALRSTVTAKPREPQ
jgi:hypothetical protein